jgi:hypothetical protein
MWNHAATMRQEVLKRKISWPELTSQDLTEILIYTRNMPGSRAPASGRLDIRARPLGERLFTDKGCAGCHTGKLALANRLGSRRSQISALICGTIPLSWRPFRRV